MTLEETLIGACARGFPDRRHLRITGLTEIKEGWECQVFAFDAQGLEGDVSRTDALILRIYQGAQAIGKCEGECTALEALHRARFPVPAVVYRETAPGIEGKPFVIMERIAGPQLADLLRTATAEERNAHLKRFCHLFAELHRLDWRPLVPNAEELETRDGIALWLGMARRVTGQFGIGEFDPVLGWLEEHRRDVRPAPPSATHNDYHPWNVLCPSPQDLVVIDWTNAEIQDYRFDLAWMLLLARSSLGPEWCEQILAEYEAARGAPVEDLAYFEVIAASRRIGDIFISLRHGAEAMGMRPGAEAIMRDEERHLQTAVQVLKDRTGLVIPLLEGAG